MFIYKENLGAACVVSHRIFSDLPFSEEIEMSLHGRCHFVPPTPINIESDIKTITLAPSKIDCVGK